MNGKTESPGTIDSYLLHTSRMGDGSGKPDKVILNGMLIAYVGIGWIDLHEATEEDKLAYPVVVHPPIDSVAEEIELARRRGVMLELMAETESLGLYK